MMWAQASHLYVLRSLSLEDEVEVLANILRHFNAEELREARLVSRDFNEVICTHPKLLWAKNRIIVNINSHPTDENEDDMNDNEQKWAELKGLTLIHQFCCPSFHFLRTDLRVTPGAQDIFRSSTRLQIKHLKLTQCEGSSEDLFYILVRVSGNLEYLEIVDLSDLQLPSRLLYFRSLTTIVLTSQFDPHDSDESPQLSYRSLQCILCDAPNLKRIALLGWSSETCRNCFQLLHALPAGHIESIQYLEIYCVVREGCPVDVEQYFFIKDMKNIRLPSLKKLKVRFNREFNRFDADGFTRTLVEEMTQSVAAFLESSINSLEILELSNCPVSSAIFKPSIGAFPNLFHLNTQGSLVISLDRNGEAYARRRNPILREPILDPVDSEELEDHPQLSPFWYLDSRESESSQTESPFLAVLWKHPFKLCVITSFICTTLLLMFYGLHWAAQKYPFVGDMMMSPLAIPFLILTTKIFTTAFWKLWPNQLASVIATFSVYLFVLIFSLINLVVLFGQLPDRKVVSKADLPDTKS